MTWDFHFLEFLILDFVSLGHFLAGRTFTCSLTVALLPMSLIIIIIYNTGNKVKKSRISGMQVYRRKTYAVIE